MSSDLERRLASAREHMVPQWKHEATSRALAGARRLMVRRRLQRRFALGAGGLVFVTTAAVGLFVIRTEPTSMEPAVVESDPTSQFAAAPVVDVLGRYSVSAVAQAKPVGGAVVEIVEQDGESVGLRLHSGQLQVTRERQTEPELRIYVARFVFEVAAATFELDHDDEEIDIIVHHGEIRVRKADRSETRTIRAGERVTLDASENESAEQAASFPVPMAGPHVDKNHTNWRTLLRRGEYDRAYELQREQARAGERMDAGTLMDAADAARLSGHPKQAAVHLRMVLDRYGRSSVAPLAAFTLGRVLFDLGRFDAAAVEFASARALAPSGVLAEDALAREVEASAKAGDANRAKQMALHYFELYPDGRRRKSVRMHGGIE